VSFFRYSTSNNDVSLKSVLGITHCANLCTMCTLLKSFAPDSMALYSLVLSNPRKDIKKGKIVRYGRLRSFNVTEIGTNRKPICDFLLVFHSNCLSSIVSEI